MYIGLPVKYLLLLSDFKWDLKFHEIFLFCFEKTSYQNSWKSVQWELSCSMRTDGWIDGHTWRSWFFFQKMLILSNFMKIRPVVTELFHADGRVNRLTYMTKLVFFPKNVHIIKFNENPSSGNRVVPCGRTGEQTDIHDEVNNRFPQFCWRAYRPSHRAVYGNGCCLSWMIRNNQ